MGEAKRRGSFEDRKKQAIAEGREKKANGSRRYKKSDLLLEPEDIQMIDGRLRSCMIYYTHSGSRGIVV